MWKTVIIDDDRKVLQGMKKIIPWEELGAEFVGEAENGDDGLELIRSCNPDIIITDIYMPGMNGLEMLQELTKTEIKSKIVILSGYTDFEYARQALSLNVTDYLVKPVSVPTLLDVLKKVILQLEAEEKEKRERVEFLQTTDHFRPLMEKEFLKSLITGAYEPHYRKMRDSQSDNFTEHSFQMLAVELEDTKRLSEASSSDVHLFRYAVANVLEELLQVHWPQSNVLEVYSRNLAVLIRYPANDPHPDLNQLCRLLIDMVLQVLSVHIRIGIGSLKHEMKAIADSTEEAFSALVSIRSSGKAEFAVIEWQPPKNLAQPPSVQFHRVRYYQEIADAIGALQEQRVLQLIGDFSREWSKVEGTGADDVQRVASEIWTIFAYALNEAGYSLDDLYQDAAVKDELGSLRTPSHFVGWIEAKIPEICERLDRNGENIKHRQAVDFIVTYIHEHYAEDIRLGEMADKVHLSRNYLSTLFRNAVGETFQNYITKVRMDNAKRLILEGKYRIYEVADKVGYRNVPYFTSMFKKHTGRNPTDLLKEPTARKNENIT